MPNSATVTIHAVPHTRPPAEQAPISQPPAQQPAGEVASARPLPTFRQSKRFPRIDREMYGIDDEEFVLDLLRSEHVLVTHGTGFNWPEPDHFRIVCLPEAGVLEQAIASIARYLERRRRCLERAC